MTGYTAELAISISKRSLVNISSDSSTPDTAKEERQLRRKKPPHPNTKSVICVTSVLHLQVTEKLFK